MAESDLIRGNVDTIILRILYEGDRYGYEIIKQITDRNVQADIKQPTIYTCLKRLEKQGFISSYWDSSDSSGGRRKYYSLTDRGREVFITYRNEWERSRDLFGELISGEDRIIGADDFSDVEEESYIVPKRRSRKKSPQKPKTKDQKPDDGKKPQNDDGTIIFDHGGDFPPYRVDSSLNDDQTPTDAADDSAVYGGTTVTDTTVADTATVPDDTSTVADMTVADTAHDDTVTNDGYIQESFLHDDRSTATEIADNPQVPTEIGDPRAIIEELYASTFTGADSYYHARGRTYNETYTDDARELPTQTSPQTQAIPQQQERQQPATAQTPQQQPTRDTVPPIIDPQETLPEVSGESMARREYRDVLNRLAEMCDQSVERPNSEVAAADEPVGEADSTAVDFEEVRRAVAELGNDVTVREHNDSAKVYTHRYQYYSNRLMLTQYTITCALMFALGLILFLTFYFGLNMRMKYDNVLYIFAGLFPIVMFLIVVLMFVGNPDKKRNINIHFRSSIIMRIVMMLQVMVVFYCLNLIWGMPVTFSAYYTPSIVIPFVYALFVPISKVIFMGLLNSGRYNAD